MCVAVRDLVINGVLTDMMAGRPAVYATFASYDEVAHHSGIERADTLEALHKLDQQFGRIERARRYRAPPLRDRRAVRPRPDPGRHLPAAQRYGLEDLVRRALSGGTVAKVEVGDENDTAVGRAVTRPPRKPAGTRTPGDDAGGGDVIVLGSGNSVSST